MKKCVNGHVSRQKATTFCFSLQQVCQRPTSGCIYSYVLEKNPFNKSVCFPCPRPPPPNLPPNPCQNHDRTTSILRISKIMSRQNTSYYDSSVDLPPTHKKETTKRRGHSARSSSSRFLANDQEAYTPSKTIVRLLRSARSK